MSNQVALHGNLALVSGNLGRERFPFSLPMSVGSAEGNALQLTHPMVARLHCILVEIEGAVIVQDNCGKTFINDRLILEEVLKPGDKLTIGPFIFVAIYRYSGDFPVLLSPLVDSLHMGKWSVIVDKSVWKERVHELIKKCGLRTLRQLAQRVGVCQRIADSASCSFLPQTSDHALNFRPRHPLYLLFYLQAIQPPRDETEAGLQQSVLQDRSALSIYCDYLEEQGDLVAQWLRELL